MKVKGLLYTVLFTFTLFATGNAVHAEETSVWKFGDYFLYDYQGEEGNVTIPETLMDCPVTGIGIGVFGGNEKITSIVFPETVTMLDQSVAYGCNNLTDVTLPQSLQIIGDGCFAIDPMLTEVTIPSNVCYIGEGCFNSCDTLTSVTFEGVCPIFSGDSFLDNPDMVLYVPDDELAAYQEAFSEMDYDTFRIEPSGKNAIPQSPVSDEENLVFDADTGTITGYLGFSTRLDIPETINGVPVKAIGEEAFKLHSCLSYVTLPEGVTKIQRSAFEQVGRLYHVQIPSTLKTIEDKAFFMSYHEKQLSLPEGLTSIGTEAFAYSFIDGVLTLPEGLKSIADGAFLNNLLLDELYLPTTLESIGENAFAGDSLSYIYMAGLTPPKIAATTFEGSSDFDVDLNEFCTKQQMQEVQAFFDTAGLPCRVWRNQNTQVQYCNDGEYILNPNDPSTAYFAGCASGETNIRAYDITREFGEGKDVVGLADEAFKGNQTIRYYAVNHTDLFTYIGKEAFADSSLEQVDLFDSVTTIGAGAFRNCSKLQEITIPESVTEIGEDAFTGCTGLTKVTVLCDAALLPENAFADCPELKQATVVSGRIPVGMFANSGLTEISIGESVTAIGAQAFYGTGLTSVNLRGITEIGSEAFADAGLTEVQLGEDAITIGQSAFAGNPLQLLVIPANQPVDITSFAGISNDVLRISDTASDEQVRAWSDALEFPWYDRLLRTSENSYFIKMPYQPSAEEDFEFDPDTGTIIRYHGSDVDIVVPRTIQGVEVRTIGYNAFDLARDYTNTDTQTNQTEWLKLRSLILPETVTSIEDSAFSHLQQLETFICYGPLTTTGGNSFFNCTSLKNVIFVNGVQKIGDYLFDSCTALQTVWYKGQAETIGEWAFVRSGIKKIFVNAKNVGFCAFSLCNNLKELHVRDGVETFTLSAIMDDPSLELLCFEMQDASPLEYSITEEVKPNLKLVIPENATEEQAAEYYLRFGPTMEGIIGDESQILRGACEEPENPMPDIQALLAAYGIQ